jgi:putative ABC transport system substrate-binding protein
MKRREFIAGLGSAAAAWPLAARAQQPGKLQTIGYVTGMQRGQFDAPFFGRLRELGWIEGRNIAIEYRSSGGNSERSAEIATELVHLKVTSLSRAAR